MSKGESSPRRKYHRMSLINEDRISTLDDHIVLHVLSFLPTEDAIKTCVLSKMDLPMDFSSVPSFQLPDRTLRDFLDNWTCFATRRKVEELSLDFGLNLLDIASNSMKKLVIESYWSWKRDDINLVYTSLEIFAPNIQVLEVLGHFGTKCQLVDVSSLVSAHIGFELNRPMGLCTISHLSKAAKYDRERQSMLRELLSGVRHVKELTFGFWCLQVNTLTMLREQKLPHESMARLLRNIPHLEKLTTQTL
ncbi:hypothetical protein FEM48_Zijuj12G0177200 [Ziziphus jujuba var. spinosa]|uniref:Uncharacterized protein n=1 Tax=Ziziphus jujuba var. spinosa TaxID=714518 RepID=A0A978UEQ6_ZIZJJ|nr:hypothetical protein FEM48_Zijuj12G0177200 [Ziziphus jujuba var. spinosa]